MALAVRQEVEVEEGELELEEGEIAVTEASPLRSPLADTGVGP